MPKNKEYKLLPGRVGAGGFKCPCCRHRRQDLKAKRIAWNRAIRRILKRLDKFLETYDDET